MNYQLGGEMQAGPGDFHNFRQNDLFFHRASSIILFTLRNINVAGLSVRLWPRYHFLYW